MRISRGNSISLENLDDNQMLEDLEQDPRKLGQMMRELSHGNRRRAWPVEFDDVVERLERGENPEEIANSLPDEPADLVTCNPFAKGSL